MRAILPRTKKIAHHILLVSLYSPIIYKEPSLILTCNKMFEMQKKNVTQIWELNDTSSLRKWVKCIHSKMGAKNEPWENIIQSSLQCAMVVVFFCCPLNSFFPCKRIIVHLMIAHFGIGFSIMCVCLCFFFFPSFFCFFLGES